MSNWPSVRLGDSATFINGYAFKPNQWSDEGLEIIRIQNLTRSSNSVNYFHGDIDDRYLVNKGDLLISWSATLGVFEWTRDTGVLNQHIFKVVFNKLDYDKKFFRHLISFKLLEIQREVHGSTMLHITKKRFDNVLIPYPPLPVQKRIAEILDLADDYRQKTKALIDKYDELAQSIFLEMFGDTFVNTKKWKEFPISELASKQKHSIKAGPFGSSLRKEYYVESGYKIYGQEQVIKDDLNFGDYYISQAKYDELAACKVKSGDLLISLVGTFGKISLVPENFEKGIINPRLMKISPNTDMVEPEFLKILLQSKGIMAKMKSQSRGGTMDIVNVGIIKSITVPIPPLELQRTFLDLMNKIKLSRAGCQISYKKADNLFDSLLQKAFKGELVTQTDLEPIKELSSHA